MKKLFLILMLAVCLLGADHQTTTTPPIPKPSQTIELGLFDVLETFDTITIDGFVTSFSFRGTANGFVVLFVTSAPESGFGGYMYLPINTKNKCVYNFKMYRYILIHVGEQTIKVTKEVY